MPIDAPDEMVSGCPALLQHGRLPAPSTATDGAAPAIDVAAPATGLGAGSAV